MLTELAQSLLNSFGLALVYRSTFPPEATAADKRIIESVLPYTMSHSDRLWALVQSVRYIVKSGIPGDFVECGAWRGGSAMAMALTLRDCGVSDRRIWVYDTFAGMTAPTTQDVAIHTGKSASDLLRATPKKNGKNVWSFASKEEVAANLASTGYNSFVMVEGDVTETLKTQRPSQISLLRLDTDFYESTKAELLHLYPLLVHSGVCILDDYGYWRGAKQAVDEYFAANGITVLLNKIDGEGRSFVKP